MTSKIELEASDAANIYQPDGDVVDLADIDTQLSIYKEFVEVRLREEHIWPHTGETYGVSTTGLHTHFAARVSLRTWAQMKEDETIAKVSGIRDGYFAYCLEGPSDSSQLGRVLVMRRDDGKIVPAIKHIRGLTLVSGGLVNKRLEDGFNNRSVGTKGVIIEDQNGVPDTVATGIKIGFNAEIPYADPNDATRQIWIEKCVNSNWEKLALTPVAGSNTRQHVSGSNETFIREVGDYGGDHKGSRFEFHRDCSLVGVSDNPGFVGINIDGVIVKGHNHTGGTSGDKLTFNAINNDQDKRLVNSVSTVVADFVALEIEEEYWTCLGSVVIGDAGDGDAVLYELTLHLAFTVTSIPPSAAYPVPVIVSSTLGTQGVDYALTSKVIVGSSNFIWHQQKARTGAGNGCYAQLVFNWTEPGFAYPAIPTITKGGTYYLYARCPASVLSSLTFYCTAHVKTFRR